MALYCFFSKSFVKILGTRQTGNHSAIIGPRVNAKEDPKAIRAKLYTPVPGRMISQDNVIVSVERRTQIFPCPFYQSGGSCLWWSTGLAEVSRPNMTWIQGAALEPRRSSHRTATLRWPKTGPEKAATTKMKEQIPRKTDLSHHRYIIGRNRMHQAACAKTLSDLILTITNYLPAKIFKVEPWQQLKNNEKHSSQRQSQNVLV